MLDVQSRWRALQVAMPELRLYALVDGVQYQTHLGKRPRPCGGQFALFAGTPDALLAHAGPWLIDATDADEAVRAELATLESTAPALIWLIAAQELTGLGQLLQLRLDIRLPDGRGALLRFWDPRVLITLVDTLDGQQREDFFGYVHEWHFLHEGQRIGIGRQHADAQ